MKLGQQALEAVNELNGSVEAYQDLMQAIRDVSPFPVSFEEILHVRSIICRVQH